jgi:hypothetical protein
MSKRRKKGDRVWFGSADELLTYGIPEEYAGVRGTVESSSLDGEYVVPDFTVLSARACPRRNGAWFAPHGADAFVNTQAASVAVGPAPAVGVKYDDAKPRPLELLPWDALSGSILDVLEYGARKHAPLPHDNWRHLPNGRARYAGAAMRHAVAYACGERVDPESGLPTLAHLICSAMFALCHEQKETA